jgi:pyruvate dehydrogenase E2 component (dihydrolipoamide acetyltransferase)
MPVSVTMPRLGESVTEGTVTRWLKQEGDRVEADEPLLEVSTDKVDTEIPAPAAGVLSRIVVHEDETAEVGSELAIISGDEESGDGARPAGAETQAAPAEPAAEPAAEAPAEPAAEAPAQPSAEPAAPAGEREPTGEREPAGEGEPAGVGAAPAAAGEGDASARSASVGAPESDAGTGSGGPTTSVTMPALGESVTEGTVTRWLKSVGDRVEADEPLLEVSTDKVDTEIPAPASGTLIEIKVAEDETAPVGAELAVLSADGAAGQQTAPGRVEQAPPVEQPPPAQEAVPAREAVPAEPQAEPQAEPRAEPQEAAQPRHAAPEKQAEPAAPAAAEPAPAAAAPSRPAEADGGGYVTPLVRKLAAEHGVDLTALAGTGVGGRIRKQDVLDAAQHAKEAAAKQAASAAAPPAKAAPAAKAAPSPLRGRTEKMSRLRSIIAKRMVESLQVSAQLTTVIEVDVTKIAKLREQAKNDFAAIHGVKLSFLPFFALATVEALRVHPNVNASIDVEAGTVTYHDAEHLGIAVDTERGLLVPVIRNAGDLNLAGLAKRIADLAERTRTMKIEPDELSGGTFTLTNTGSRGALFDTPIINQPQVGILGTGAVVKRAAVVDDPDLGEVIVPRSMAFLALSYDHRLVDGADAARFLSTISDRLQAGNFEADLGLS